MSDDTADQALARAFNPSVKTSPRVSAGYTGTAASSGVGSGQILANDQRLGSLLGNQQDTVVFHKDALDQWRWTRKAANGEIVGASSEGYKNFKECRENLFRQGAPYDMDVE